MFFCFDVMLMLLLMLMLMLMLKLMLIDGVCMQCWRFSIVVLPIFYIFYRRSIFVRTQEYISKSRKNTEELKYKTFVLCFCRG